MGDKSEPDLAASDPARMDRPSSRRGPRLAPVEILLAVGIVVALAFGLILVIPKLANLGGSAGDSSQAPAPRVDPGAYSVEARLCAATDRLTEAHDSNAPQLVGLIDAAMYPENTQAPYPPPLPPPAAAMPHILDIARLALEAGQYIGGLRYPTQPDLLVSLRDAVGGYTSGAAQFKALYDGGETDALNAAAALHTLNGGHDALTQARNLLAHLDAAGTLIYSAEPQIPAGTPWPNAAGAGTVPTVAPAPATATQGITASIAPEGPSASPAGSQDGSSAVLAQDPSDVSIRVLSVEPWPGIPILDSYIKAGPGMSWLTIELQVTAMSAGYDGQGAFLFGFGHDLRTADGHVYQDSIIGRAPDLTERQTILPLGATVTGWVTLAVPDSVLTQSGLVLEYFRGGIWDAVPVPLPAP